MHHETDLSRVIASPRFREDKPQRNNLYLEIEIAASL